MTEQSCDNIPDSVEVLHFEEVSHIIEGRDLEALIAAPIETLKRNNKKCGKRGSSAFSTRIRRHSGYNSTLKSF